MDPLLLLSVAVVIALVIFAVHKVRGSGPSPPPGMCVLLFGCVCLCMRLLLAGNDTVNEGDDGPAVAVVVFPSNLFLLYLI